MEILKNFQPYASAKMTAGATSSSVNMYPNNGSLPYPSYCICNKSAVGAYIAFGTTEATPTAVASGTTPAANCHYIQAGTTQIIDAPLNATIIAAIRETTDANLEISIGRGN